MASRFLSQSKLISKFSKESRAFSVLKDQQNNNNKKLNLVVSRRHKGSNLLSIGDNDNFANFSWHHHYDYLFPDASCNNKLLLRAGCNDYNCSRETVALLNPTTGEINTLPPTWSEHPYDHHKYPFYGLGFDPTAPDYDYKVIRVIQDISEYDEDYQLELYSLKTNSWKLFNCPSRKVRPQIQGPSLFINGSYCWPVLYFLEHYDDAYGILRFDFANEKFSSPIIPLPDTFQLKVWSSNLLLAEFEGSVAVVAYSLADELAVDHEKPFEFEIWVWNDESLSWDKRGEWVIIISSSVAGVERPLGLFNNDQLYLQDFLGELVLFDCATGELKNLGLKSDQTDYYGTMSIFAYVESSAEEVEVIHRENEKKMKIGTLSNSTTSISKLASIVNDSKPKPNNNNNNRPKLLFSHDFEETLYFSQISPTDNNTLKDSNNSNVLFNFPRFGAYFMPAAGCNSALLLCYIDSDGRAALWNPTTDEVKKLPDQLSSPYKPAFDPVLYGFGFDPEAERNYKVIRFIANVNVQAELYSLKADSWKDIPSSNSILDLPTQPSLYVNGFCYWVASTFKSYIISFDFANEIFSSTPHIPLPPPNYYSKRTDFHNLLAEFHGSLAALVYPRRVRLKEKMEPFEKLELWVWKNDETLSSWSKVSAIHLPAGAEKPLGLFGNDQLYLQGLNGEVLLFNCAKGGEFKRLGLSANKANWGKFGPDCIFPYVESSFPLNGKKIIRASHKIIND